MRHALTTTTIGLAVALALAAGCRPGLTTVDDGGTAADMTQPPARDMAQPPLGAAIDSPKGTWTWVDFPDSYCDDGSHTGIGIKKTDSKNLLVFMNGGGACWDYLTCFQLNTAAKGPFAKPEFDALVSGGAVGSILDGTASANPFKDWNMVFVPYCTGDVHSGDNIVTYTGNGTSAMYHHKGRSNVTAYLKRLGATYPSLDKLVVSGSSAGGFGASFDYDLYRSYLPAGKSYLLNDSGPALEGNAVPSAYRAAWYKNWRLDKVLDPICPQCTDDLSEALTVLSTNFQADRLALLSSTQDKTIRGYFLLSPTGFEAELLVVAKDRLDTSSNFRYFFQTGEFHTFLGQPGAHSQGGVALYDWLTKFVNDDPSWQSVKP